MSDEVLRRAVGREIKRALAAADVSVPKAVARMEPDSEGRRPNAKLIYRWINGEAMPPLPQLQRLATAIGQPITVRMSPTTNEALPQIEAGLSADEIAEAVVRKLAGRLEALGTLERQLDDIRRLNEETLSAERAPARQSRPSRVNRRAG